jgi:hypothetical protein
MTREGSVQAYVECLRARASAYDAAENETSTFRYILSSNFLSLSARLVSLNVFRMNIRNISREFLKEFLGTLLGKSLCNGSFEMRRVGWPKIARPGKLFLESSCS